MSPQLAADELPALEAWWQRMRAAISDGYYEARNDGETMEVGADRALAGVLEVIGADAPDVWDAGLPPGGYVCGHCGIPVESEPCREHQPRRYYGSLPSPADLSAALHRLGAVRTGHRPGASPLCCISPTCHHNDSDHPWACEETARLVLDELTGVSR